MEGASATKLRFKESSSSRSRPHSKKSHSHSRHSNSKQSHHSYTHSQSHSSSRPLSSSPEISSTKRQRVHKHRSESSSKHSSRSGYTFSEYENQGDGDDSQYSREAAYRQEQDQEKTRQQSQKQDEEDSWMSHLFDELANDNPYEYHSDRFEAQSSYYNHYGDRRADINDLSDADYISYMRRGMKRSRQDKSATEWQEWVQEQEEIRHRKDREERKREDERRSRKRKERKERERLEAEMNTYTGMPMEDSSASKLRKKISVEKARDIYENGWKKLLESNNNNETTTTRSLLSMDTIPWPPLNATQESSTSEMINGSSSSVLSLFDFLFFGTTSEQKDVRKQILRREQLRFHPDKFRQRFGSRLPSPITNKDDNSTSDSNINMGAEKGERERILGMVDRVARALNEISELL